MVLSPRLGLDDTTLRRPPRAATYSQGAVRAAVALVAVGILGVGCSEPTPSSDRQSNTTQDSVKSVFGTREERDLLHLAEETLQSRCMMDQGFEYQVVPLPTDTPVLEPYGHDDVELSQAEGYGLDLKSSMSAEFGDAEVVADPNAAYVASLSAARQRAFTEALFGPPGGKVGSADLPNGTSIGFPLEGCLADARAELYKDGETYMSAVSIIDNLATEVQTRVTAHDDYIRARDQWRSCMNDRGYDVERPSDAVALAIAEGNLAEIDIAVADAECSRSTSLVTTAERLEAQVWVDVLDDNAGVIDAYRELRDDAIERARSLLES